MANSRFLIVAGTMAATFSLGAPAHAVSTVVPVYQGTAFVKGVTSACTTNGIAIGDFYTMIYRQLVEPSNTSYGGGVSFITERSAVSYVMPASKPLNSGTQTQSSLTAYGESGEAGPYNYSAGFSLKISSPGTVKKPAADVIITGTLTNFFNYTGCTITIGAALELRP